MIDYEVQRCTRHCAVTGRELQPGETFYSTLSAAGAQVVRNDYSQESWQGPPEGILGWWKSHMPARDAKKMHWAPNDVMLDLLETLESQPDKQDLRYVLALLLIRRRVVRLEETERGLVYRRPEPGGVQELFERPSNGGIIVHDVDCGFGLHCPDLLWE